MKFASDTGRWTVAKGDALTLLMLALKLLDKVVDETIVCLCLHKHAHDLFLREMALVVGDGDAICLAVRLVGSGRIRLTVHVDVDGDLGGHSYSAG